MADKPVKTCKRCGKPAPKGYHLNYKWYCDPCYEIELPLSQMRPDDTDDDDGDDRSYAERLYHGD